MAVTKYQIVSSDESEIHDEPHLVGSRVSRVTVRQLMRSSRRPSFGPDRSQTVTVLDVGEEYEALAYYHRNPEKIRLVEAHHCRAVAEATRRSSVTPESTLVSGFNP